MQGGPQGEDLLGRLCYKGFPGGGFRCAYILALSTFLGAALFNATPGLAHHSNVAFEVTKVVTITGVVKDSSGGIRIPG